MSTHVTSADPSSLGGIASEHSGVTTTMAAGAVFPANYPPDFADLPNPDDAAKGVIGNPNIGGPSHGNAPGPSPADGVSTDIYDTQPEEPMTALAPWQGGVDI